MNPHGTGAEGDSLPPLESGAPGETVAQEGATAMPYAGSVVRFAPGRPIPEVAADAAVLQARRLFERALAGWVMDLLALRRAGLNQPAWNAARQARFWRKAA
jgi:hypothetical protein